MYKKATFLSNFVSKTVTWIVAFLYICSTFLSVVTPAEAAKNSYNNARNNYTAGDYSSDNYRGDHLEQNDGESSYSGAPVMTRSYVLTADDTLEAIAKRYNLSVEGLRQLNQNRFFRTGFANAKAGDTVDVPVAPVSDEMARYLEGRDTRNGNFASIASQAGQFLANGGHSAELESMASGYLIGRANNAINQWFNQYGTSRIQLNIDDDFSLKNSQFEMLLPLYDKGSNLVFTQSSIHRTDDRTQTNLGIGYRYFAPDFMLGGNAFWDYDISRSHSRMGLGLEYWRDYLKVSLNGYYRLSDWRHSSDLDDYYERPANGWDIRAEGYLPSFPQLGMKLNFEQYYGKEVGLFGKDSRQKNPYAVTVGATYTPFPLMTFDLEHKRGGNGNNDTRLGFELNYRFGVPLSKQLDPDAVDNMRTLAGSRYDLVNRNNNIVLEYKKEEVIRLSMADHISGYYNETRSLGISVESKYDVSDVNVMAPALIAAGGKIIRGAGRSDYSVVLPPYQKVGSNDYTVTAIATDVKGHSSALVSTIVTVIPFKVDNANSTFTPAETTLPADEVSNVVLTLSLQTSKGTPSDIDVTEIKLDVQGRKTAKVDQYFKRVSPGIYELTVTAGTGVETLILTPSVGDERLPSAKVNFVPDITTARTTDIAVVGDGKSKVADGVNYFEFNATVRDEQGNLVPDAVVNWSQNKGTDVILSAEANGASSSSVRAGNDVTSKTNQRGIAVMRLVSTTKAAYDILVSANVLNDSNVVTAAPVSFTSGSTPAFGDGKSTFTADKLLVKANDEDTSTLTFTAKDEYGNGIKDLESRLIFAVSSGNADGVTISAVTKTVDDGVYKGTLKGTLAGAYKIVPMLDGTAVGSLAVNITLTSDGNLPDTGDGHSTFTADKLLVKANDDDTSTLTFTAKDVYGNGINNLAANLTFAVATGNADGVTISAVSKAEGDGVYTGTLKGTLAGAYKIVPMLDGTAVSPLAVNITLTSDGNLPDTGDGHSTFTADKLLVKANDADTSTLTFTAKDEYGNGINNLAANLTFAVATGNADGVTISAVSKAEGDGVYTGTLKGTLAGAYKIVPMLAGTAVGSLAVNITLTSDGNLPDTGDGHSTFTADKLLVKANDADTSTLTFTAKDEYGNGINNLAGNLTFAVATGNADGVTISAVSKAEGDGVYTGTLKGTLAGAYKIVPKLAGTAVGSLAVNITLTSDGNLPDTGKGHSTFTADKLLVQANDADTSTLTFTAKDAYGNGINNLAGNLTFAVATGNADGVTISAVSKAEGDGVYTGTLKGTLAGAYKIVPMLAGTAVGSLAVNITLTSDGNLPDTGKGHSTFETDKSTIQANGEEIATLTFTAKDAYGNGINNLAANLTFAVAEGNTAGVTISAVSKAGGDGVYTGTLKGTLAGAYKIVPKLAGTAVGSLAVNITLTSDGNVPDTGEGRSTFDTDKSTIQANGEEIATLTFTAKDAYGNGINNLAGNLTFAVATGNAAGVTISAVSKAEGDGVYTGTLKGTLAGAYKIVPMLAGTAVGSLAVNITLTSDGNVPDTGKGHSTFTADKLLVKANDDDTSTLTFTAKDAYGNGINNLAANLTFAVAEGNTAGVTISAVSKAEGDGVYTGTLKGTLVGTYKIVPMLAGTAVGSLAVNITLTSDGNLPDTGKGHSTFTADKLLVKANDDDTSTLTFTAKDAYGNGINNLAGNLTFVVAEGNTAGVTISEVTKAEGDGVYTGKLKGTLIGTYKIAPKVGANVLNVLALNIQLSSDGNTINAMNSKFESDKNLVKADNLDSATLTFTVKDKWNNPIENLESRLTFGINTGSVAGVDITSVEKGTIAGTYVATLKGQTAGSYKIVPSLDGRVIDGTSLVVNITLTADANPIDVTKGYSSFTASKTLVQANNSDTSTLTFKARDKYNNPINGLESRLAFVVFTGNTTGVNVTEVSRGEGEGIYVATIKGTIAGEYTFVPKLDNSQIDSFSVNVTFTADNNAPDANDGFSTFKASKTLVQADDFDSATLTFTARDQYHNAINGLESRLNFKLSSGNEHGVTITTVTRGAEKGTYIAILKGTIVGDYKVIPTLDGTAVGALSASVTLTSNGNSPDTSDGHSTFKINKSTIQANDTETATLTLVAKDRYGNAIDNLLGRLTFNVGSGSVSGVTISPVVKDAAAGVYTATVKGTIAGLYSFVPRLDSSQIDSLSVNLTLTSDGNAPDTSNGKSTFTADKLLVKANDDDTSTLTFTAKDVYGNGINNLAGKLTFAVATGNAAGVTISAVSKVEGDGVYKGTLKGTLAGAYKIVPMLDGAAVGSLAVNITLTSDGNLPDASDGHSTFTANKTIVDADNNDTATLTFEARDRFGNTINNLAGSLAFVVSTGEQTGVTISTVRKDSADGIYTATLKGTIAGRYTIIPMVGGSSVGSGLFVNITLKADRNPISNDNSTFTTDKNLVKADNTDFATLTFTTRDQFNNPINNLQARLTFVVATGSVPGVNITGVTKGAGDGVYVATLKGKTAGIYKIIPKLDNAVIEGVSLYVNITLSADGNPIDVINGYSSFTASKPSILANNIETTVLILKARDQYNNPINNLESKLNFAVLSGNAAGVTIGTIAKGAEEGTYTALVKGTIAGRYTFIPKVEDTAVEGLSAIVTLVADGNEPDGTTGKSTFTADKTSIMANDDDSSTLTFTAKDEYGNLLNNLSTSDLAFAISGGNVTGVTITAVQRGSFTGTYTAKVHGTAAGEYTIVPLYKGVQVGSLFVKISLTADSNPIDLNNTQTQFTADKTVVAANGEDFATLTFTAKDKYNNAINNLASRLKFVISSGNVAGVTIDTVAAGTTAGTYVAKIKGTVAAQYTIVPKLDDTQVGTLSVTVKLSSDNNPIDVESGATTFTTEKDVIAANDVETSTLTLTAKDKFGNPIDNLAPKLKFVISTGDVPGVTIDTVAAGGTSGTYVAKIKGTVARKFNIIPKRDDAPIGSLSVNVTLSADNNAVNAEKSTFETEKETVAANGLDTTRLVFTAKDQYDNPINNLESKLVFALSTAVTGVDITAVNRGAAAGTYVATLKGTVAGRYTISPKLSGVQVGSLSVTVTLTADGNLPVSGDGKSTFTTEKSYIAANNSETTTLTFTAKDEFNNVINNIEGKLVFAVSSGNASGVTIDTVSKGTEPGTYVAKLRGTVIGQYTIVPKYNGTAVSGLSVNVELTENIEVVMSWTDGSATGTASVTKEFKVGVRDRSNNAYINGKNVDFTIVGDRGGRPAIYPLSITSNTSGDIPVAISDDKAEVVTVTGQIRGTPIKASLVVTIKPGAINGSVSTVKANPSRIAADGTSTSIISYTPLDSNGNLITDLNTSSITTDIVGLSDIGLSIGPWHFDAGEGKYKATLTAGTKVGRIKVVPVISGSDGIDRSKMDYTLTLVAGDFDKHSGSVYADPDKLAANGRTQSTIVFKPKDKSGNAITSIDPRTISQKITRGSGSSMVPDTAIQMTAWSLDNGVYTSTLTSSTQTGVINIMPTVNGNDAADSGTVGTLELLPAVLPATKFEISNEGNALADGIMTEKVTITLRSETDSTVMPFKSVTVTAFNSELAICDTPQCSSGNRLTTFTGTSDANGKVVIYLASTLAAWQGYNRYTVSSDGYNVKMQLPFGLYVDQEKSYIALSKDYLYNNGTDQIVATFRPFDKVGNEIPAGLLTMSFYTTDTDTTSVLTPQGYSATLSSKNQAFTTYQLYAVMTNYSQGWQPQPVTYNIRPETGVLLSTIDFNPKLCGLTVPDRKGGQSFICSQSDFSKYQSSALGFVINMKKASSTWNKQMYLTSRDITGQILITEKGGSTTQNCSVPVQSDSSKDGNAWMNDFGRAYPQLGLTYSLMMDFNHTSNIDTIRDYPKMGNHGLVNSDPPGGMGLCDLSNWGEINKTLSGYGNVKFAVRTFDPQGYAQFEVPLTNNRVDAGIVSPTITVSVYSTAR